MATEADNLDARMEAIRLKNEELEKKHKEIQEDEQNAKLMNAVVDVRFTEIPKNHPYDHIDLDFDVKDADKELVKNPDYKPKNRRPLPRQDLLDEIPPDPVNFLREDGDDDKQRSEPSQNQRQPNKNRTQHRNRQDRPKQEIANNDIEGSLGDIPPRRNQNPRPRQPQQQQNRSLEEGGAPKRSVHPQQLRNERRAAPAPSEEQQGPQQHTPNRQRRQNYRPPNKNDDRNNITVEITDGDVRSVKLKSTEKTFGTGRVGHSRPENIQKFTVDTFDPKTAGGNPQQDRSPIDKPRNRNPKSSHNRRSHKPKEQLPFQHPTLDNIIITKASVQDRLLKIAKNSEVNTEPQSSAAEAGNAN